MLVFIIPVKSKQVSQSWSRLSQLFARCLQSVCNQTNSSFQVIVVCHEKPDIKFHHSQVNYVRVDFPPPNLNNVSFGEVKGIGDIDKAKKISIGLERAKQFKPSHIMVVDADDCVNKNLAELVTQNTYCNGWYFKRGYVYEEGKNFIFLNTKNFNQSCGTSIIIKYDLFPLLFTSEHYYNHHDRILQDGTILEELPCAGAIYIIKNGENQFMTVGRTQELSKRENRLFYLLRKILKYRLFPLTRSIKNNFGLYDLD